MNSPSDNPQAITLTLPSDVRLLSVVRRTTQSVCELAELEEQDAGHVVLAVYEAATNAIVHAHRDKPEETISIVFLLGEGQLEIRIADRGETFDIDAVPNLDPGLPRPGGRGVFLVRQLMDEVSSTPRAGGGNEVRLVKRHAAGTPAS